MELRELVLKIQGGELELLVELMERFEPLVITWLKRTGELYSKEKEDLMTQAKIILLESVERYDNSRGVPFQSFYKINLWNWYGNYRSKKKVQFVALNDHESHEEGEMYTNMELEEKRGKFSKALTCLNEKEQKIIIRVTQGFTVEQISKELHMDSKKVSTMKYRAINKLKREVAKED